jgi:hypothetical protein
MWSQFPPNLSRYNSVVVSVVLSWFPQNLSCLQNDPPENNVEQFPPNLSCLQNKPLENNVEDLAENSFYIIFQRIVLGSISFRLNSLSAKSILAGEKLVATYSISS